MATLVQQERIFTIPATWTPACLALAAPGRPEHTLMDKVENLESAKRCAAASYSRLAAGDAASEQALADEHEVLAARVDVLTSLLLQGQRQTPLCLTTASGEGPRVCVTYDRLRCEGDLELGPMQSTMAWAVPGAQEPYQELMAAPHQADHAPGLRRLLELVAATAPHKDILGNLQAILALPPPDSLALKRLRASPHDPHTRVCEGLSAAAKGPVSLYRVTWGALDLDVLEGWQNPSTNAAIRLSILNAASPTHLWTNTAHLQVRISRGEECHVLTLRPFWDSESCTVSHLQFAQPVFDVRGHERGLLNLSQDPNRIAPLQQGQILPLQGYVCIGAHRKSRLSEAQLNYVHAQGLLAHGFDPRVLPGPLALLSATQDVLPPAKATRVSADRLDVMASSFRAGDQVYTTISVVQYPPFGTQFEKAKQAQAPSVVRSERGFRRSRRRLGAGDERESTFNPDAEEFQPPGSDHDSDEFTGVINTGNRPEPSDERARLLYTQDRDPDLTPFRNKQNLWDEPLCIGEHYFIDGIYGSPYDRSFRLILFEVDNGLRYQKVQDKLLEIKSLLYDQFGDEWDPSTSFYGHVARKTDIKYTWSDEWASFLRDNYSEVMEDKDEHGFPLAFWYSNNPASWRGILGVKDQNVAEKYIQAQEQIYNYWKEKKSLSVQKGGPIPKYLAGRSPARPSCRAPRDALAWKQLPLPQTVLTARAAKKAGDDPAVARLQSRVAVLETKLSQTKQDENTQFLLSRVLERLDSVVEEA